MRRSRDGQQTHNRGGENRGRREQQREPYRGVGCYGGFTMGLILLIILVILVIGALPTWPYSAGWGYYPGGALGVVLLIVLILLLLGRL